MLNTAGRTKVLCATSFMQCVDKKKLFVILMPRRSHRVAFGNIKFYLSFGTVKVFLLNDLFV